MNTEKNGPAQAAILSAMLGILALAIVNLGTTISKPFKGFVHSLGKLWIPGAEGIGPYSGKETVALIVWLLSWFIFHKILKDSEWNQQSVLSIFLLGVALATTLLWPPVFEGIAHYFH